MPKTSDTFELSSILKTEKCQFKTTEREKFVSLLTTYLFNTKLSNANSIGDKNQIASSFTTQLSDKTPQFFVESFYQPWPPHLCIKFTHEWFPETWANKQYF